MPGASGASSIATLYVRYIQLRPLNPSFSVPAPWPHTVLDVVTLTVVDVPAASVALVDPDDAKTTDVICGTAASVKTAVCAEPLTFVTRKTFVSVRAEATVPKFNDRLSTLPLAAEEIGVTEK